MQNHFFLSDVALAAPGLRSLACRLGSPWAPCIYPDFERYPPKWFSAITCAIWLRLIFRGRGSAWFFGAHLLFFHARGRILEARVGFWIPRSTFWPGDLFGSKKWSRKKLFCGGIILWWGFRGIHPAQMNSMVPGTHMGRLLCPQTPLKNISRQIPPNPENCRWPLPPPCGLPYSPWWLSLFSPWGPAAGGVAR